MKIFTNANLVLTDGILRDGFLAEKDGRIACFGSMESLPNLQGETIDCGGLYLSPGFIDTHTHGAGGFDFMDGRVEDIVGAAKAHLSYGTTALLPTTLTSSDEELFAAIDAFLVAKDITEDMPELLGLHLEGPYFNVAEKGAQDAKYICFPTPEHYNKIVKYAKGTIKRWSLAPELPGAIQMVDDLCDCGIVFSAAHTCATCEQMKLAYEHGVRHLTHFYSAMSTITRKDGHRILGVIESGYLIDGLTVEIISDGIHLPPDLLKMILRCKDNSKISLVTDSMRGAGMPEGPSILGATKGGQPVIVQGGIAKMPDLSCFAGSVATTDRLVRVMVTQAGLSIWEAVKMMTLNPAKLIGCSENKGSLENGKHADIILFDDNISVKSVYVRGEKAKI